MSKQPQENPVVSAGRDARSWGVFLAVAIVFLAFDLVSKTASFERVAGAPIDMRAVREHGAAAIPRHDAIIVIPKILAFQLTTNEGAVFGIGAGNQWFFVMMSVIAIAVIGTVFYRSRAAGPGARWLQAGLALVLAGALGNMYDRVMFRAVRDMLHLFPGVTLPFGWRWPGGGGAGNPYLYPWIFNIADVILLIGVGILMVLMWRAEFDGRGRADSAAADAE